VGGGQCAVDGGDNCLQLFEQAPRFGFAFHDFTCASGPSVDNNDCIDVIRYEHINRDDRCERFAAAHPYAASD
jgi:hypothetical protein